MAIDTRHVGTCKRTQRCRCNASYRAVLYYKDESGARKSRKGRWRKDKAVAAADLREFEDQHKRGETQKRKSGVTVSDYWQTFYEGMLNGTTLAKGGTPFRPATQRGYLSSMSTHILPSFEDRRMIDIETPDVQNLVDDLAMKLEPSTVHNAIKPLRAIYRHGRQRGLVNHNPADGIDYPKRESRKVIPIAPAMSAAMIATLPEKDQAIWATAFYAGLRLGELRGLLWEDVDLDKQEIHVRHGYDDCEGRQEPKTLSGVRTVPLLATLRPFLAAQKLRSTGPVVFAEGDADSFSPGQLYKRATTAWMDRFERITPHYARHTFVSVCIDAGVNEKKISTWAGHSDLAFTMNTYGHLFPEAASEDADLLDSYLKAGIASAG